MSARSRTSSGSGPRPPAFAAPSAPADHRGRIADGDETWCAADVTDPLTGERRTISDFRDDELTVEFRQDLTARRLAWGFEYTDEPVLILDRFNEIDRRREAPSFDAWIETTALPFPA